MWNIAINFSNVEKYEKEKDYNLEFSENVVEFHH